MAIFDPRTPQLIFMKIDIYNYLPHAKCQWLCRRWWSGHESLSFFLFFIMPTGRIFGRIATHNTSLYVVCATKVPFGVRKMKFDIF